MNTVAAPADTAGAVVIARVLDAPPATVFRLWSDPARVKEWWHPKDFTTPTYEMDFRVGGAYRYTIRSQEQGGAAHGIYREIDAPNRIVMSFRWDSGDAERDRPTLLTVTFEAQGEGRTLLTLRHEPFSSEPERISHTGGWGQVLDAFGEALAGARS